MTARAVYEATPVLIDWLSHHMESFEQSTWVHYRDSMALVNIVTAAEEGRVPKFAALSAIRQHNENNGMDLSYESILSLDTTHIFSDCGEWVVFTDDARALICSAYDDAEEACTHTPDHIDYVLVWDTMGDEIVVYKSPHRGKRRLTQSGGNFTCGTSKGDVESFVLPPDVEASLYESLYADRS